MLTNGSRDSFTYAGHPDAIWYWCLRGIIAFIATIGNALIIYIIVSTRRLWTQQNCFVLSLCTADLCTGVINTPMEFICTILVSCDMWLVQTIKDIFLLGSVLNLCAITLDRYIAVRCSFKYYLILTTCTCAVILVITWVLSIATPFVFYVIIQSNNLHAYRVISTIRLFLCQLLPMICLVGVYLVMLRISKAQRRKITQQRRQVKYNYSSSASRLSVQRSSVHFIGFMVMFFVLCYSLTFYRAFCTYVLFIDVPDIIVPLSRLLYYINSALDFAVYALVKGDIRREIRKVFGSVVHRIETTFWHTEEER